MLVTFYIVEKKKYPIMVTQRRKHLFCLMDYEKNKIVSERNVSGNVRHLITL